MAMVFYFLTLFFPPSPSFSTRHHPLFLSLTWHSYGLMIFMTSYVLEYMLYSFAHCLHSFRLCGDQI